MQQKNSIWCITELLLTVSNPKYYVEQFGFLKLSGPMMAFPHLGIQNCPLVPYVSVRAYFNTNNYKISYLPFSFQPSRTNGRIRRRRPHNSLQPHFPRRLPGKMGRLDLPRLPLRSEPRTGRELGMRAVRQQRSLARRPVDLPHLRSRRLRQIPRRTRRLPL